MVSNVDQQLRLGERFDAKLTCDGGHDFAGLGGEGGGVNEDSSAEFLVVEGVDELFHEGYGDGGIGGEFYVERGELDF
jgi:hypothetical protein